MHGGLDAHYEKVRVDTRVASQGDLVIPVVRDDGFREILAVMGFTQETN
jgi:hypothetical protein